MGAPRKIAANEAVEIQRDTWRRANKKYRDKDPEATSVRNAKYKETNYEQIQIRRAKFRDENKERLNRERRAYYQKNSEKEKTYGKEYAKRRPEVYRAATIKRRTLKTKAGGCFTAEEWFILCFACGFKCLCCGEKKPLEADHVIPVSKGGPSWLWNIQPLCTSCNNSKKTKETDYRIPKEDLLCPVQLSISEAMALEAHTHH
jgi:5-methylcytosine-specific restriction endonuclease McrA